MLKIEAAGMKGCQHVV